MIPSIWLFRASVIRRGYCIYASSRRTVHSSAEQQLEPTTEGRTRRIKLANSLKERKYREKHEKVLLEGWRLINDALLAEAELKHIFFSEEKLLSKLPVNTDRKLLVHVDSKTMQRLSSTVTPPGIVGVFKRPSQGTNSSVKGVCNNKILPLAMICDGFKDPSNLGTLIRVCAAAGCKSLTTTKGSMDVWDPKVLRCAAGGHFRLPIFYSLSWTAIEEQFDGDAKVFIADSNISSKQSTSHYEVDWTRSPSVLIVGGETSGLSDDAHRLIEQKGAHLIRVPMVDGIDSLSAATAATIVVYEAYRQRFHN